jgi:hypothetical protein
LSARYTIFTYLYVNTSEFDNAANHLPRTEAARVRAPSKPSDDQNREFKCALQVPMSVLMCHEGACCGEEMMSTEAANGNNGDYFMLAMVHR